MILFDHNLLHGLDQCNHCIGVLSSKVVGLLGHFTINGLVQLFPFLSFFLPNVKGDKIYRVLNKWGKTIASSSSKTHRSLALHSLGKNFPTTYSNDTKQLIRSKWVSHFQCQRSLQSQCGILMPFLCWIHKIHTCALIHFVIHLIIMFSIHN